MLFGIGTKAWAAIVGGIVLAGAVITGAVVADGEDFDPVHAPQWKAGYSFSYDVTADIASIQDGLQDLGLPAETNLSVGPIPVKKEVLSTQYRDSDGQPVYLSAATFPLSNIQAGAPVLDGFGTVPAFATAERQSDLAPIPVLPNFECQSNECPGGGIDFFAGNDMPYLNFPLSKGKYWEAEVDLDFPVPVEYLDGITRMHVIGEVGGMETLDLPVGETEAVRVDISYTPVGLQQVISDFATSLEDAGFELERFNVQLGMHEILHYSPDYEAVVQQQYIVRGLVDVALKGSFQGYDIDEAVYAEANVHIKSVLTGANRIAGEELSPLQVLNTLTDADLIADARGKAVQQVPFDITLDADQKVINVAEQQIVAFDLGLVGVESLPDGFTLGYEVSDLTGRVVDVGPADGDFAVVLGEPGIYTVLATAYNPGGQAVSQSGVTIEADYKAIIPADCTINILAGTTCDEFQFPVNAGIQSLIIEADSMGPTPPLQEWLYVQEAGENFRGYPDTRVEYTAEDLSDAVLGDWAIYYDNYGGIGYDVDYVIIADYGVPELPVHHQAPQPGGAGGQMADLLSLADGVLGALA